MGSRRLLVGVLGLRVGHAVEEIDETGIEGVFGADDDEFIFFDQVLEDGGSAAEVVGGVADVGADGLVEESFRIVFDRCF